MIEVSASLPRGPVFLAGETIQCDILFANIGTRAENEMEVSSLAWASVQIICQCTVSESRVLLPRIQSRSTEDASTTGCDTSFVPTKGERGLTVLSTKPKILFCDLKLHQGESRACDVTHSIGQNRVFSGVLRQVRWPIRQNSNVNVTFQDAIPTDAPPSFRGQAVKYSYKLIIGTQRLENITKMLRIPFRVMVLYGLNDMSVYNEREDYAPSNPFLKLQQRDNSVLDIALQVLSTVTARKAPHSYNITNARGRVAKFLLFKQAYKLGEDIVGIFDFTDSTVPCVQYSVTLQSEEQIAEECRRKPSQGTAITSYVKHQEMCLHTLKTHVSIPIPLTASPGFITDIVCLRWRLHFEFVTSSDSVECWQTMKTEDTMTWRGPPSINVETMVWDMPIKVFPTNPLHASSVTLMKTSSTIRV